MTSHGHGAPLARLFCASAFFGCLTAPVGAQVPIFSDGFESGGTGSWPVVVGPQAPPEPFRFADLDLRDPHLFVDVPVVGCFDFTDTPLPFGLGPSFNGQLADLVTQDGDGDGLLDLSLLLLFRPLEVAGADLRVDLAGGLCWDPLVSTSCDPDPAVSPEVLGYDGQTSGFCLQVGAGTTSGYSPGVAEPLAPCFGTDPPRTLILDLNGVLVPLTDARIAAAWVGAPPTSLVEGLLAGFLTEADADNLLLPPDLPLVGGQPLSILLPGGTGNCAAGDDRDTHLAQSGWWFYLNFTAEEVPYTGS